MACWFYLWRPLEGPRLSAGRAHHHAVDSATVITLSRTCEFSLKARIWPWLGGLHWRGRGGPVSSLCHCADLTEAMRAPAWKRGNQMSCPIVPNC